jgi:hypothetical protein
VKVGAAASALGASTRCLNTSMQVCCLRSMRVLIRRKCFPSPRAPPPPTPTPTPTTPHTHTHTPPPPPPPPPHTHSYTRTRHHTK